jgi:O-antigen/teichoic acid export membrane protein
MSADVSPTALRITSLEPQPDSTRQIIDKAQKGIGLSLLVTAVTLPATTLLYVVLGRIGPKVLGYYALVTLLTGLLMTFGFFGDSLVYVKFIPETPPDRKASFVVSHSLLVLGQGGLVVGCLVFFPRVLHFLLGSQASEGLAFFALLLGPVVWSQGVCSSILQAVIDTGWQSFASKVPTLVSLAAAFVLAVAIPAWFARNYQAAIISFVLLANVAGLVVFLRRSWSRFFAHISLQWGFYLPKNFWKFSIPLQLSTLASFAFQNLDQFLTIHSFSIATLGQYKAILSFGELVRLAPVVVATTTYPLLVHLEKSDTLPERSGRYTRGISDLVFIASAFVAVICILFGPELLKLFFGKQYSQVGLPLAILSVGYCLTGVSLLASAVLISRGRSDLVLAAYIVASIGQLALSVFLIPRLGLIGVVVGRIFSICIQAALTCYWARTGSKLIPGVNLLLGIAVIGWLPLITAVHLTLGDRIAVTISVEVLLSIILLRVWRQCIRHGLAPAMVFAPWRWL